jgi:hypothetical protein
MQSKQLSGFSFIKTKTGDFISKAGEVVDRHRIDVLKDSMKLNIRPQRITELFFDFSLTKCASKSTLTQLKEEIKLYKLWKKRLSNQSSEE